MIRIVGIIHSKFRNAIGLVGIEVDPAKRIVRVKLARQWDRKQLSTIPSEIGKLYKKFRWDSTYIDLTTGQHFITQLRRHEGMNIHIITTQKNVKDTNEIAQARIMDKVEMVQFMVLLKQNHQIEFPPNPPPSITELEEQIALYTEKKTEAGNIDYYAPGDELDNLTKALLIACFAARKHLEGNSDRAVGAKTVTTEQVSYEGEPELQVVGRAVGGVDSSKMYHDLW